MPAELTSGEWLRACAEEMELDGVELVDLHFPSTDPVYLRDLKKQCTDLQLTIAGLAVSNDFGVGRAPRDRNAEGEAVVRRRRISRRAGRPRVRGMGATREAHGTRTRGASSAPSAGYSDRRKSTSGACGLT